MGGSASDKSHKNGSSDTPSEALPPAYFDEIERLQRHCAVLEEQVVELHERHASIEESLAYEKCARTQLEREFALAQHELEASQVVQSQFIDNMNHELRTPLNGILGMTQLVLDMPINSEIREYVETIERSGTMLDRVISSILDYSQLSSSSLESISAEFELETAIEAAIKPYSSEAFDRRLEFYFLFDSDVHKVVGDQGKIQKILEILLDNAVKFTSAGHICVEIKTDPISASTTPASVSLQIKISDTGIGMAGDMHQAVFEPFRQADGTSTRAYGGIGMGLAICKKLVELLNGTIEVISQPGKGATFIVSLQLESSNAPAPPAFALTKGLRLGVLSRSELMYRVVETVGLRAGAKRVQWFKPSDPFDKTHANIDILLVDHPIQTGDKRVALPPALLSSRHREHPRLIALVPPDASFDGSIRALYDVIAKRPIIRQPLLEAIEFAALMLDRDPDDGPEDDLDVSTPERRILILEPVRINQKILVRMLESLHYDFDISEHLEDLKEKLTSNTYHAILINPQIDSSPHFSTLKSTIGQLDVDTHLPAIIAITGKTASYNIAALRDAGISRLLVVPIKLDQLREALAVYR